MIRAETIVRSGEYKQSSEHTLFVEGIETSLDTKVIEKLLHERIRVKPFGPSSHIAAAARALVKEHPNYYFLIDRDHYDDNYIQKRWDRFPDPDEANLLVWFRRELENYFIIPEYLLKSQYLVKSEDELRALILKLSKERLFLDAVNLVIIQIREELKEKWIQIFENVTEFTSRRNAINKLLNMPEFMEHKHRLSRLIGSKRLENHFTAILESLTGGKESLEYGRGHWLEMLKGKRILPTVINECFSVRDAKGNYLQGSDRVNEVVKDLVRKPLEEQPDDFQRLYNVINARIAE
ncbi:hypothetical protein HQ587_05835 [bacterium]|nr:hypothetical protein [bacterium]